MTGSDNTETGPSPNTTSGSSGHVPDSPETARQRILKRIEDVAVADQVGFQAMMLDKIGRQNHLNEKLARKKLRDAGVDVGEDDSMWAGVSAGNEYHYHMEGGAQGPAKNGQSVASKLAPYLLAAMGIPAAAATAYYAASQSPGVDTDTTSAVGARGGIPIEGEK